MATGGATDEYFDNLCSVCTRKNKNTEAQNFCTDCQESFCSICVNSHNDFLALRSHQILDKAKFQPGSSVQFPMVPTERCKVHGHKPVDMYCKQHDAVGCSTCMVLQHSACNEKTYIPDCLKNKTEVENSSSIVKQLGTIASALSELHKAILQEKRNLYNQRNMLMQEIRKFWAVINRRLMELEMTTVNDFCSVFKSHVDMTEARLMELQAVMTEVQYAQDSLKSAGSNLSQMFVSIKMANDVASKANEKVIETQHKVSFNFVPNQKLQTILNELQALGSFSVTEKLESQPRSPDTFPSVVTNQTNTKSSYESWSSPSLMKTKGSKKYRVTEKSEISCIWSVCELDDGTIILSDSGNSRLILLDSSTYRVRHSCDIPEGPCQVCPISNQEVAVCCYQEKIPAIQFVSIGTTMQRTRQILPGFDCACLAYAAEKLFISDDCLSVYVYTITGQRLQQFSVPLSEDDGYFNLRSLAVSSDGSTIYVAHRTKGLIIMDRNGQLVGQSTDPKLQVISGVCLYNSKSVLVCGQDSNNVLQFTSDGQLIGEVLKRDKRCMSVCYFKKNSKLVVGSDDEIEVYDINQ